MIENNKREQELAIAFVKDMQEKFTLPIENQLDSFLSTQKEMSDENKADMKKMFMVTIGNSLLLKSKATKKELKLSFKGLIEDYNKLF